MPESQASDPMPAATKDCSLSRLVQLGVGFMLLAVCYLLAGLAGLLQSGIAMFLIPFVIVLFSMAVLVARLGWPAQQRWEIALASLVLTLFWFSSLFVLGGVTALVQSWF